MNRRAAAVGWSLAVVLVTGALVLSVANVVLGDQDSAVTAAALFSKVVTLFAMLAFASVGALVVARRPETTIGWVFLALGAVLAFRSLAYEYAILGLLTSPGALPGASFGAALGELVAMAPFALFAIGMLLFPDGRPPSARWRRLPWIVGAAAILGGLAVASRPFEAPLRSFDNPLGVGPLWFDGIAGIGWMSVTIGVFAAGVAMVQRLRRARGVERQQLKWVAFAAALFGATFVVISISYFAEVDGAVVEELRLGAIGLGYSAVPIAVGIAILRYRLYDIDVVINRTLVYAALTATLAGAYLLSVLLLQLLLAPLTEQSDLAIAGSTLAVAGLFRPARRRIQAFVDRRFFRRRYDATRTLERFGMRLRDEVDLAALGEGLRAVVGETMQPAHVSLWLREPERVR